MDIRTVVIDKSLSKEDRIASYLNQIKDPHNFKCKDIEVVVTFAENGLTLEECIKGLII